MRWSISLGRLFGIRIELHVTFLLLLAYVAATQGLFTGNLGQALESVELVLLGFGCVVLHELGHALAARRYGIATRDIVLLPIGGVARLERMPEKPRQEVVVALAGPAVNVLIASTLVGLARALHRPLNVEQLGGDLFTALLAVNVIMVLFNMIPAFPMDGGRVLRALLAMRLPYDRATRIASGVGQGVALVLGAAGLFYFNNPMLAFVALFVFLAAGDERAMVQTRTSLKGLPVRAAMLTEFHRLEAHEPLRNAVAWLMSGSQQDFPVLEDGQLVGVLTRSDLMAALQRHGIEHTVGEALAPDQRYADADEPLEDVMQRMRGRSRSAMPVLENGRLVGLVTLDNVGDLLRVREALRRFASSS